MLISSKPTSSRFPTNIAELRKKDDYSVQFSFLEQLVVFWVVEDIMGGDIDHWIGMPGVGEKREDLLAFMTVRIIRKRVVLPWNSCRPGSCVGWGRGTKADRIIRGPYPWDQWREEKVDLRLLPGRRYQGRRLFHRTRKAPFGQQSLPGRMNKDCDICLCTGGTGRGFHGCLRYHDTSQSRWGGW